VGEERRGEIEREVEVINAMHERDMIDRQPCVRQIERNGRGREKGKKIPYFVDFLERY
jgi:hypothetical protein